MALVKMEWKVKRGEGWSSSKRMREDTLPLKKHRSAEFSRSLTKRVVSKLNLSEVRSIIIDSDAQVVMRSLGGRMKTFSSQQTVYLESAVEEDVIGQLQTQIANLQAEIRDMRRSGDIWHEKVTKNVKELKERVEVSDLFLHQGMSNALRSVSDLTLGAFFKACGKENMRSQDRREWLSNSRTDGVEAFVFGQAVTLIVFEDEKKVGKKEVRIIRCLKRVSSDMSSSVSHSATPLEVVTALEEEGVSVFAGDFKEICGLFRSFCDVTTKKMVKDWKEGNLHKDFKKKFKTDRSSHI